MSNGTTTVVTSNTVESIIASSSSINAKVDKVDGKQLSTEDYTNAEKTKLSGIEDGAQVNVVKSVSISGSGNTITNATFSDGSLSLTKGSVSTPSEATDTEVNTGTATTKFISPAKNTNAVKTGIIKNAENRSLDSANQKTVQTWLGTNQLTFTFNDNTTRTFNFVCNEAI